MTESALPAPVTNPAEPAAAAPELDKGYEPAQVEARWARYWEEQGLFHAEDQSDKPAYSIVLPPPNVTGSLHLGHALTATMQDVLIRFKRMSGFNACWLPGIDHAGIATQMVVERELQKKEGKSRHDLGREQFLERVWAWKEQQGSRIALQHRVLGASLDWQRERFTMDEQSSRAVREAFVRLYEDGLLYRAERLINWCVKDGTALSDLEVDHEEGAKSELYKFAYPLANAHGEIVVATTRPETMLGDTAIAVHPDDPRYKDLIGKHVTHPILHRTFPIIADAELVDPKFGTGAVKVTPAHSFEDFEVGKRHGLPLINILNLDGTLNGNAGEFQGQDRIKVRAALKARLAELGLERGTEPHTMALGKCQRCSSVVEPLLSKQWFVKTGPLAAKVIEATEAGRIEFVPANWRDEFFRWMRNIHDWCVSRQLWWGHQIPAWFCENGHVTVARAAPTACAECGSAQLKQDPDVLDTWFSSGLWPFSTFGWPEQTAALRTFYPNSVMETGFDILFFWVARMAMLGLHFMGEVPFRTVFLHAMVRDEKGEKMSKTRGNVIDPLDLTATYGADALRFTLAAMAGQGRDIKLSKDRIGGYRSFANKIWNAARFVLMNAAGHDAAHPAPPVSVYDRWILSRYQRCADETRLALDELRLSDAANGIYRFIWNELCDWAIELSKAALYNGSPEGAAARAGAVSSLLQALEGSLRLLHPFMPFVTEEIWQRLPRPQGGPRSIMIAPFPAANPDLLDAQAEAEMDLVARAIDGARSVRGEVNLPPNMRVPIVLIPRDEAARALLEKHAQAFGHLAYAEPVRLAQPGAPRPQQSAVHVEPEVEVHLPLAGLIDFATEKTRVEKELVKLEGELAGIAKRLGNAGFVERAPKEVVEKDRARADELTAKREKLARHLARVTTPEGAMQEDKNSQNKQAGENAGQSAEQGHRSLDQMGTHGGPAGHPGASPSPAAGDQKSAAASHEHGHDHDDGDEHDHDHEEGAEEEGFASKAISKVKSIARAVMSKEPSVAAEGHAAAPATAPKPAPRPKAAAKPAAKAQPAAKPVPAAKAQPAAKPAPKAAAKPAAKAATKPAPKAAAAKSAKAAPAKKSAKAQAKPAAKNRSAGKAKPPAKKAAAKAKASAKKPASKGSAKAGKKAKAPAKKTGKASKGAPKKAKPAARKGKR
jgi:valyl-tRNA synthetase